MEDTKKDQEPSESWGCYRERKVGILYIVFFFQASFSGSGLEGTISTMDGDDGRASEIGEGEEEDVD